jgi:RimJ/RimL family protein N-acetyltransferase
MDAGRRVGAAQLEYQPWDQVTVRSAWIEAVLLPEMKTMDALNAAFAAIEKLGWNEGAEVLVAWAYEGDAFLENLLLARGYERDRVEEFRELDLVANAGRLRQLADASRQRMQAFGVDLQTLDRWRDHDRYRKLHACFVEASNDVPRTIPWVPEPFEEFMHDMHSPSIREDRVWIALKDGEVVGQSNLSYPPVRGNVWTSWTGTARGVRGQGVARALKLETLMQAMELGVKRVRTGNDEENAPILHLNDDLGYVRIPGRVDYLKRV